jgi:hypothetical protein
LGVALFRAVQQNDANGHIADPPRRNKAKKNMMHDEEEEDMMM